MTINIEELKRDREAGTDGPWEVSPYHCVRVQGSDAEVGYPPQAGAIASLYDGEYIENKNNVVDARRIARLPDLEAAFLEAVELLEKFKKGDADYDFEIGVYEFLKEIK